MRLARGALDDLQTQGKVAAGSMVNVATSYAAIAVITSKGMDPA